MVKKAVIKKRRKEDNKMYRSIEKHSIKISIGVAITVVIFLIAMTANFVSWKAQMESNHQEYDARIKQLDAKFLEMKLQIEELDDKATARDIQLAEIKTKLINIEALLVDIKSDLREHQGG